MTPLRQRMLEDMQVRNLSPNTQRAYVESVARFARHFNRSPVDLGPEEIRTYQVYLVRERQLAPSSLEIAATRGWQRASRSSCPWATSTSSSRCRSRWPDSRWPISASCNRDGSLDTSFDLDGKVTTDFGFFDDALAVAIQPNGKIVAAGTAFTDGGGDFALARYNPDGSLDTSFNLDGKVTTDFGLGDLAIAMAVRPNGKIVAAGIVSSPDGTDFALARYNPDGSLDATFGSGGKVTTDFGPGFDAAFAVAIQPDGKIVAAGPIGTGGFALAQYNRDGSLDATFGSGGKVTTDFGDFEAALGIAILPDGRIVAAGITFQAGTGYDFALARYLAR